MRVAENLAESSFRLPRVTRALAAKHLTILVVGAGSSQLPGSTGVANAYPGASAARTYAATTRRRSQSYNRRQAKRTATEMVKSLPALLSAAKPALLVWQTGTVDAISVDPDQFSQALDNGINAAHSAGADVVLINAQYSPRTESMIALGTYAEDMRWVALQHEVPLFDRFSIMRLWSDLGTFDLYSATKKLDTAERVHDCIGRLLADFVITAAKPEEPPVNGSR